ncbi:sodium:proton antiporter [Motiliproteus sp. SC1-56]|uniref:cation:proton antiporter n=1 Tax=Motiliproteus sp. SC1-56 TaxID=2799565 RepID=UPI001A8D138F|nr:cation:proton antiporter [Motiliproteus sp. SC1-56]
MNHSQWFLLVGALLLVIGFTAPSIKRLPVTSAIIYLAVGVAVGPTVLSLFHINPLKQSALLEILTEVAVLISLFAAGIKMPVPISLPRWRAPILMAFVSMSATVGIMSLFGHFVLGLPLGAAVLLGAILAPTDPVLASDVQIRHPGDRDRLRFNLTCEAGMNDGTAFPFVMLGLGLLGLNEIGGLGMKWMFTDVLWATGAGIAIGLLLGTAAGQLGWALRRRDPNYPLLDDFIGLGLIAATYGLSDLAQAWGSLAVFFAAVALRHHEHRLCQPCEPTGTGEAGSMANTTVSGGSLVFKEHLERLSVVILILLVGGTLFLDSWSLRAVATALFLFLVARPLSVFIGLAFSRTPDRLKGMIGWFGVRGIGTLYYLMYAIQHGLPENLALELTHLTLIVVTLSIVLHGISVKPLLNRFWRSQEPPSLAHCASA